MIEEPRKVTLVKTKKINNKKLEKLIFKLPYEFFQYMHGIFQPLIPRHRIFELLRQCLLLFVIFFSVENA